MPTTTPIPPPSRHRPALALFAGIGSAWVFVLVTLGAFTTSIGAGMAFPDWPLSNGSINPEGWLEDVSMFAEHSHRLSGMMMGLITIGLAVWISRVEERRWVRHLAWWALGIVIFQGLIGGNRVLLDRLHVPGFQMSLGQMLRVPHGVLAQLYACLLIGIAVACSRSWIERPLAIGDRVRRVGLVCCALLVLQLIIATTMRHNGAGLAILTFPHSTPEGIGCPPTGISASPCTSRTASWPSFSPWRSRCSRGPFGAIKPSPSRCAPQPPPSSVCWCCRFCSAWASSSPCAAPA
jgi:cytochrome c oxidase assembly protein subunit 15